MLDNEKILVKTYVGNNKIWVFDKDFTKIYNGKFIEPSNGPSTIESIKIENDKIKLNLSMQTDKLHRDYDGKTYEINKNINIIKNSMFL